MSKKIAACLLAVMIAFSGVNIVDAKNLPEGFHDFRKIRGIKPTVEMSENVGVLCSNWRKVISFSERMNEGLDEDQAIYRVNAANKEMICSKFTGIRLVLVAYAVRGDSQTYPVAIQKYRVLGTNEYLYGLGLGC